MNLSGAADQNPWDQFPEETAEAFRAFGFYKRLPIDRRSLQNAWAQFQPQALDKMDSRMNLWFNRFHWEERAAAWDNHLEKIGDKTIESVVKRERLSERVKRRAVISMLGFFVAQLGEGMRQKAIAGSLYPKDVKEFAQSAKIYAEQSRVEYHDTDANDAGETRGSDHADASPSQGVRAQIQQVLSKEADAGGSGRVPKLVQ